MADKMDPRIDADHEGPGEIPVTWFAPPGRSTRTALHRQFTHVARHPATSLILNALGGMVFVLNEQRQIVAANQSLLASLNLQGNNPLLGMRPGEVLDCTHHHTGTDGCGTSQACRDCGAVLAILACGQGEGPVDQECTITPAPDSHREPYTFRARAMPLNLDGHHFTLVTLLDISSEKQRDVLRRVFYHDLANLLTALCASSDLFTHKGDPDGNSSLEEIRSLAAQILEQVRSHRDLESMMRDEYTPSRCTISAAEALHQLRLSATTLAANGEISLIVAPADHNPILTLDPTLLQRVLHNMVTNAIEASQEGQQVRIWCASNDEHMVFNVWNEAEIPSRIALRMFERNNTTKSGTGHGLGTYSMKIITERYLRGTIGFSTGATGTTFSLSLPQPGTGSSLA